MFPLSRSSAVIFPYADKFSVKAALTNVHGLSVPLSCADWAFRNSMSLLAIAAFAALAGAGPVPPRVSRLSGFPFSLYGVGAPANVNHGYAAG